MSISIVRALKNSGILELLGVLLLVAAWWNWLTGNPEVNDSPVVTSMLPQEERSQILGRLPRVMMGKPRVVKQWATDEHISWPSFSPNGHFLLLGGEFGGRSEGAGLYETHAWKKLRSIPSSHGYATFSPDSHLIATDEKGVSLYRARDAAFIRSFSDGSGRLEPYGVWGPVTFSQDGSRIATYGEAPKFISPDPDAPNMESANIRLIVAKVWDVETGKQLYTVHNLWSNDNNTFTFQKGMSSGGGELRVFEPLKVAAQTKPLLAARSDSWSGNSEIVSIQGGNKSLKHRDKMWLPGEGAGLYKPAGIVEEIPQIEKCWVYIAADASIIIGSSAVAAKFWVWRVRDGKLLRTWTLPGMRADAVAISEDAQTCAVVQPFDESLSATNGGMQGQSIVTVFHLGLKTIR